MTKRKQKTRPRGRDQKTGRPHKPIEIPVPKRGTIERMLKRAANAGRDAVVRRTSTKK